MNMKFKHSRETKTPILFKDNNISLYLHLKNYKHLYLQVAFLFVNYFHMYTSNFLEINPISLDEDTEFEGVKAFQIWNLVTLLRKLRDAGLKGDVVVDVVLLFLVVF